MSNLKAKFEAARAVYQNAIQSLDVENFAQIKQEFIEAYQEMCKAGEE